MAMHGRFGIISLKQFLGSVKVINLGEAKILACSPKFDFCVRISANDLQRMRRIIRQKLREMMTEEATFFVDRVIKLHGRHAYDMQPSEKLKQLSWILTLFRKSFSDSDPFKRSYCDSLLTSLNETVFEVLPLSQPFTGSQLFSRKITFAQEMEAELHDGQMESVFNRIEKFDSELCSSGGIIKNSSNIPGHEVLLARQGSLDHNLPRRLLRKLVIKCISDQHYEALSLIRRYLKMISALDDAIATASGHALKGDMDQIHKLLKDEESVFADKAPAFKACFDLSVSLELFENNFKGLAFSFLDEQCMKDTSNRRLQVDSSSALVIDAVLTYCIVNKLDDLASKIMKVYCISPWKNSMLHPTVMTGRKDFPNYNWNLFSSTFRSPVTMPKVPIRPTESEKNANVRIVKALGV